MSHARVATIPRAESDGFQQFLNPASMLTPGFAGALTMMITNALVQQFSVEPGYVGLAVSFLFGTLIFAQKGRLWARLVYYVLNSLIIFCVAMGANHAGVAAATPAEPPVAAVVPAPPPPAPAALAPAPSTSGLASGLPSDAHSRGVRPLGETGNQQLAEEKRRLEQEMEQLRAELARSKAKSDAAAAQERSRFFKPWFQQPGKN
jgi:hypothetical protein